MRRSLTRMRAFLNGVGTLAGCMPLKITTPTNNSALGTRKRVLEGWIDGRRGGITGREGLEVRRESNGRRGEKPTRDPEVICMRMRRNTERGIRGGGKRGGLGRGAGITTGGPAIWREIKDGMTADKGLDVREAAGEAKKGYFCSVFVRILLANTIGCSCSLISW